MTKPTKKKGPVSRSTKPAQARGAQPLTPAAGEVLAALFCLSRDTQHISARTLADAVGLTATQAGEALVLLEQRGLVDASRARLTMLGLAMAVQLGAGEGGGGLKAKKSEPKPQTLMLPEAGEELPIAALPSQPPAPAPSFSGTLSSPLEGGRYELSSPALALRLGLS